MVSDPSLIHYACIAKGTTVLAESNSSDAALAAVAAKCLDNAPPFHARFTHTVRSRTYAFLIDDSFVYFSIFDDRLDKSEGCAFLERVKSAFAAVRKVEKKRGGGLRNLSSHCFQADLNPVFRDLLGPGPDRVDGLVGSPNGQWLWPKSGGEKGPMEMKNRLLGWERQESEDDMGNGLIVHRGRGVSSYSVEVSGHQKAKKMWRKQVWLILALDLIICSVLFGVWLWVCSGFKCIDS